MLEGLTSDISLGLETEENYKLRPAEIKICQMQAPLPGTKVIITVKDLQNPGKEEQEVK